MHLLVRANLKTTCKSLWPSFNHLSQARFNPKFHWQFCFWRSEEGDNPTVLLEKTQNWSDLVLLARDCRVTNVPKALLANQYILSLFVMAFPYRLTTEVTRYLDKKLGTVWFIDPAIE